MNRQMLRKAAAVAAGVAVALAAFSILFPVTVKTEYPMRLAAIRADEANRLGFAIDADQLNFGTLPLTSGSTKTLNVRNDGSVPAKLAIDATGNITPFVSFDRETYLEPDAIKALDIRAEARSLGNYTGTLTITVKRPVIGLFAFLLPLM